MGDVCTWTQVLLIAVLFFNVIHCQCSNQNPEVIFNDNRPLRFCDNTFDQFYECVCQDSSQTCEGLYERANNGQYWFVSKISNTTTVSEIESPLKYFRCHVPGFYATGSFMCDKFGSMTGETYRINNLCADGDVVTVSWSYYLSIETRNWLNDSNIAPVTMPTSYPETSLASKTSKTSSDEFEEPTTSFYGSLTQHLQPETSTQRVTSKTPRVVSENPSSSYANSATPSVQPEISASTTTFKALHVLSESPATSYDNSKTPSSQTPTLTATSKTLLVLPESTVTRKDNFVTPYLQLEISKDIVTRTTSVESEHPSTSQDGSQASTLNPQTTMDTETFDTISGEFEPPKTDQNETRTSLIANSSSVEETSTSPSVESQGSVSTDSNDVITLLVIGCSVAVVMFFVIILVVLICIRRQRQASHLVSFTSDDMSEKNKQWPGSKGIWVWGLLSW